MVSYGVGRRHGLALALLWLWLWLWQGAVALIGPLAWEPPNAKGAALKKKKKKKKERNIMKGKYVILNILVLT